MWLCFASDFLLRTECKDQRFASTFSMIVVVISVVPFFLCLFFASFFGFFCCWLPSS